MQPDLLWNVGGIPREAREAARAAARREGLPVGEWLTRRILRPADGAQPSVLALPESWRPNAAANADGWRGAGSGATPQNSAAKEPPSERDASPPLLRTDVHLRRIDRQSDGSDLQTSDSRRIRDSEENAYCGPRQQADALARLERQVGSLGEQLSRIELRSTGNAMKDAVKALHAGLAKLTTQTAQATRQGNMQMAALSEQVDALSSRIELANCQMEITALQVKDEVAGLGRRLDLLEGLELGAATAALRQSTRELSTKLIEVENTYAGQLAHLKRGVHELTEHLASTRADARIAQLDRQISELSDPSERAQVAQRLSQELNRLAGRLDAAEDACREGLAQLRERLNAPGPQPASLPPVNVGRMESVAATPTRSLHASDIAPEQTTPLPSPRPREVLHAEGLATAVDLPLASWRHNARAATSTPGAARRQLALATADSASDLDRLRSIAITSMVVLLLALAAAYLLYHHSTAAPQFPHLRAIASSERLDAQPHPGSQPTVAGDAFNSLAATPPRGAAEGAVDGQSAPATEPVTSARTSLSARAAQGDASAQTELGLDYLNGRAGLHVNDAQAARWLERAARQGQPFAQFRLATLYARGHGVPANPGLALIWYEAAARQGNRKAMHNLAVAYAQGSGVAVDYQRAARWFAAAAHLGLRPSEFDLAILYERGTGVPKNLESAFTWYSIAAAQGNDQARAEAASLAHELSRDELLRATRAAAHFVPAPLDMRANRPPTATGNRS